MALDIYGRLKSAVSTGVDTLNKVADKVNNTNWNDKITEGQNNGTSQNIIDAYGDYRNMKIAMNSPKFNDVVPTADLLNRGREQRIELTPTPETTQPQDTVENYIKRLTEAQKRQKMGELESMMKNQMGTLDSEAAKISPSYYQKRNQVGAQNDIAALNFAQMAAAKGIRGNASQMPDIYRNAALQNNIGSLYTQEQAAFDDINRRRSDISNRYQSDVNSAMSGIDANSLQALINQKNSDREFGLQESNVTGMYNGQKTQAARQDDIRNSQWDKEFNANEDYRDTQTDQWQQTFNYQKQQDSIDQTFKKEQARIENQFQNRQITLQERNAKLQELDSNRNYELSKIKTNADIAAQKDSSALNWAQLNLAKSKSASSGSGSSSSSRASTNYNQDNYFNGFISDSAGQDGEALYNNLTTNKDAYINNMGADNYNKALKYSQDQYYQTVVNRWRNNYGGLRNELAKGAFGDPDYYKKTLGMNNYNKLMSLE